MLILNQYSIYEIIRMDGIFGVGILEMVIIVLAILIVGGPQNAAKWAKELGKMLRQARDMWNQMLNDLDKDIGDDGREVMNAARQVTREVNQIRNVANPTSIGRRVSSMVNDSVREVEKTVKEPLTPPSTKSSTNGVNKKTTDASRYGAWTAPTNKPTTPDPERYNAWTAEPNTEETDAS